MAEPRYQPLSAPALAHLRTEARLCKQIPSRTVLRLLASYDVQAEQLAQAERERAVTTPTASGEAPVTAENPRT